jgi:hypothetical protein
MKNSQYLYTQRMLQEAKQKLESWKEPQVENTIWQLRNKDDDVPEIFKPK